MTIDSLEGASSPIEATGPDAGGSLAAAPGSITLARHGEPALSRRVRLHSAEYREWWATYEEGGLREDQTPPELLKALAAGAGVVLASTRRRALESARAVVGERDLLTDPMFIEAPLPPPRFPHYLRFSPRTWGVIARFWWWFFDHHEGQETRDQAKARARRAAAQLVRLAEDGADVMVFAHGFFNGMVGIELTRQGWRCVKDQGFRYWSARRFERR
jgi:broad specificity phosphatase PhoE